MASISLPFCLTRPSPSEGVTYTSEIDDSTYGKDLHTILTEFYENITLVYTTAEWNSAIGYVPKKGQLCVYADRDSETNELTQKLKVGDGNAYVQDLPFVNTNVSDAFFAHVNNNTIHITQQEREFWNKKVSVKGNSVDGENLILTTL